MFSHGPRNDLVYVYKGRDEGGAYSTLQRATPALEKKAPAAPKPRCACPCCGLSVAACECERAGKWNATASIELSQRTLSAAQDQAPERPFEPSEPSVYHPHIPGRAMGENHEQQSTAMHRVEGGSRTTSTPARHAHHRPDPQLGTRSGHTCIHLRSTAARVRPNEPGYQISAVQQCSQRSAPAPAPAAAASPL